MYLLNTTTKRLSQFLDEQRPTYAILSHTWGTEEVSYQDLHDFHQTGSVREKSSSPVSSRAGWRKIKACCDQALIDGFEWVWIDTCCIDKSSSAELSEAINSMFAWYRDSKLCYAFLEDIIDAIEDIAAADSYFRRSRWFTRGWTLQELLAPRRIRFFSNNWQVIGQLEPGSKFTEVVSEITSIPSAFLEGLNLQKANVAMRMSWASKRVTTRKEDLAYCLLGIFDINMPLLYGEGTKAFRRLQEEILRRTYDHSLIAWGLLPWDEGYSLSSTEPCSILATSPSDFTTCGSLNICSHFEGSHLMKEYQMSNEGLRIQLPLRYPPPHKAQDYDYIAVLDCFSRRYPSRRIAIPLQRAGYATYVRTGRSLLLSDVAPRYVEPFGYPYRTKTIHIIMDRTAAIQSRIRHAVRIDFPRHYRCDVTYVHPWYKVDKDPFTMEGLSLRIRKRAPDEAFDWYANSSRVSRCHQNWENFRSFITHILYLMLPYTRFRMRLDSIKVCVKVTKEEHAPTSAHPTSFITLIGNAPFLHPASNNICLLAPLPKATSQDQIVHPSGLFHVIVGCRSLRTPNETLEVRRLHVPDNLYKNNQSTLFKIDVKTDESPRPRFLNLQHLRNFASYAQWHVGNHVWLLILLFFYACAVMGLSYAGGTDAQSLSLAMWTFCFMPWIYEVRGNRGDAYQNRNHMGIIPLSMVLFFGVGISLYPAIQQTVSWPS